jgi:hypothetical protein
MACPTCDGVASYTELGSFMVSGSETRQGEVYYSCPACGRVLGDGIDPLAEQFEANVRALLGMPDTPAQTDSEPYKFSPPEYVAVAPPPYEDTEEDNQAGFMRRYQRRPTKNV